MEHLYAKIPRIVFVGVYVYLALPIIIFMFFWLRRPIGIPASILVIFGIYLCYKAHDFDAIGFINLSGTGIMKCLAIVAVIVFWVIFSGVGGYVWQNSDHHVRNEIFNVMVENAWPVFSNTSERIPLAYYIGYWLPTAPIGKLIGLQAGYFFQALWAVIGLLLCYALICLKRKKISVWPLLIFIFFSGLDVVGTALIQADSVEIFGMEHLEAWSWYYQFSSMTTQLFWVFNQAVPAWLASILIFLYEKPKNMFFSLSMLLLVSSFPFVGLIPFTVYFIIKRSDWKKDYTHIRNLIVDIWHNCASIQNILVPIIVCGISGLYLSGNDALSGTLSLLYSQDGTLRINIVLIVGCALIVILLGIMELALHKCKKFMKITGIVLLFGFVLHQLPIFDNLDWWSVPFVWVNMTIFYFLEAGIYLLVLYPNIRDKHLFWLNAICLYLIPLIRVGYSCDFCMRVSIPGLLLILLWCIEALDRFSFMNMFRSNRAIYVLVVLLVIGAVTPLHEIKRTYVNTFNYYEPYIISEEELYQGPNVRGNANSFFWKYLAR